MKGISIFGRTAASFAIALAVALGAAATGSVWAEENIDAETVDEWGEPFVADYDLISDWPEIPDHIFRPREPGEEEEDIEMETDAVESEPFPGRQGYEGPARRKGPVKTIPKTGLEGDKDGITLLEGEIPDEVEDPGKGYLLDQNWNEVRFSGLKGKIVLVSFFYSECKYSHCNYLNNKIRFISRKFVEELGRDLALVSISFDPAIDTVENLKIYSAKWEPDPSRWAFLTGDEADIKRVAKRFGIIFRWNDGDQSYDHSVRTFLVDREGEIVRTYKGMYYKHRDAIDDIKKLLQGKKLSPQDNLLVPTEWNPEMDKEDEEEAKETSKGMGKKRAPDKQ